MKVYIATDMEGISLIWKREQVVPENPADYEYGRRQSTADINAAIEAAYEAGATRVVVQDGHGPSALIWDQVDPRAEVERIAHVGNLQPSLDESFDALLQVGRHAMAGTPQAFLEHTQSSATWFGYRINGVEYGEIGQEAIYAAAFGVPTVFVSGDRAACIEAERQLPGVATAEVKYAHRRISACCVSGPEARRRIREGVKLGLSRIGQIELIRLQTPMTVEIAFQRTDYADGYLGRPNIERVDGRTIRAIVPRQQDLLAF